ncbi:MAG: glycosyltransferase, partial [Polyangiaceae bacterium]
RHELILHGADPTKIDVSGIPVRAEFHSMPDVIAPKSGEFLRILVTSGGFGVGPLAAIVKSFRNVKNVALTVVCGNAPDAVRRVEREAQKFGVAAKVIGFEKKMYERVADAHLVVGKAGGLTVTECMAAGRPMLIVGAVPGNEKLNEEFVVRGGAGLAPEASRVGAYVEAIRDADLLERMGRHARELVPRDSADRVVDQIIAATRSSIAA